LFATLAAFARKSATDVSRKKAQICLGLENKENEAAA
jgi:hypothetical protein